MDRIADRQKILIVDDSEMNRSILADMLGDEYEILEAENGREGLAVLQKHSTEISLVLLDIVMPEMDGFGVLTMMNKYHWIDEIPVIMISAERGSAHIERAFELGITDFISRPFDALIVHRRVVNTILLYAKQKKLVSLVAEQIYEKEHRSSLMIDILSHIVEFRNGESGLHVRHVHTLTEILLRVLSQKTDRYHLSPTDISVISTASALHDIGKIAIPEEVLNKPGRLTNEEFAVMKTHSMVGAEMLEGLPIHQDEPLVEAAYQICRWHHERWDGRGYPDGLKGDEIPISAQIVALADVYDALTSQRVYKPAFSHEKALEMICNGECGTFQPLLLECLVESGDAIHQELGGGSELRGDQRALENVAAEMLRHKELSTTDRTLRMLEHERDKYQFFASISQEIQFEFMINPPMLTISKWGAQRLGIEEDIVDPYSNTRVLETYGLENMETTARIARATTPEDPVSQYECEILVEGELRWHRIIFRSMWSEEEAPEYIGVIGKALDIHEERRRMLELEHKASHDSLTGLLNRGAAQEAIQRLLNEENGRQFALAIVDLDYFKQVNDQRGHIFGDQVLEYIAQKLSQSIRQEDIAARVGGDEFLIFLAYNDSMEVVIDRIFRTLQGEYEGLTLSFSMGIASSTPEDRIYEVLLHQADQALYSVKRNGRGHYQFYDSSMEGMLSVLSPIESSKREGGKKEEYV